MSSGPSVTALTDPALAAALRQWADWARAWVENETTITETAAADLTDAEKGALLLIRMALSLPEK